MKFSLLFHGCAPFLFKHFPIFAYDSSMYYQINILQIRLFVKGKRKTSLSQNPTKTRTALCIYPLMRFGDVPVSRLYTREKYP